ncbi:SAF domain-containing protein [Paenibacillus tarimensis]|uniref:SAF domain-containing protein n=1 Tax=Paenibacillus tarimensis TaxID=416012 RepID=UPI001F3B824D|nr:SAF domain-containing protein [Paenibacillus tarimensis]MCF2945936.1 SAF domain-containing protein [Paenibacillus tarimensis]
MNRKRHVWISLTAALLSALLVYGLYQLQLRQIDLQETIQVAVPVQFIPAGERLAAGDVTVKSIAKSAYLPGMLTDTEAMIGMETAVPLGEEEPILEWKLDQYRLLPARDESTFQIPKPYILSISNGIRAGDRVRVYTTGEAADSARLFPQAVTVASVKTSANTEIDDMQNPNLLSMASGDREQMYASRRDANGTIDAINLNLTEEEWLVLDNLCKQGSVKLVIAFSPESLDIPGMTGGEGEGR